MGFDAGSTDQFYSVGEFGSAQDVFTCSLTEDCRDDMRNGMGIPQREKIRLNI